MPEQEPLAPLLSALEDLTTWLNKANVRAMIIGGIATSVLARPRFTQDIDVLVILQPDRWRELAELGTQYGFMARVENALEFARKSHVLLLRHRTSGIDVDLVFGSLPFEEEAVKRANLAKVGSLNIPLPSPDDLIIMKAVAGRSQDWVDVAALLDAYPGIDLERVRRWVREFSTALESPEIFSELEKVISRSQKNS